jgi:hypothetical protein
MKKIEIIFEQLWIALTFGKYPSIRINGKLMSWGWDRNGNVYYNQFKTLINYIKSIL